MKLNRYLNYILLAAGFLSGAAQAQVDSFSLHYGNADWTYHASQTGPLPFKLALVYGEEASVDLLPIHGHNISLKRGQFYPADPLPQSWLSFELADLRGQSRGVLDIVFDQSSNSAAAGPGGGPHIRIFDAGNGSSAARVGGYHVGLSDGSVRFHRDQADVRVRGAPAALFNNPGPGEALEARLPTPAPGETIELQLQVMDDRGASMMLPVKISRPR